MKLKPSALLFLSAALAVTIAAGGAQAQTTIESETTTITTAPTVTTETVTRPAAVVVNPPPAVVVNPAPAVVISPPPAISTQTTTTESTGTEESASATDEEGAQVLGTAVTGNTTIVFRAADTRDIHLSRLQTWDEFAAAHPGIASTLAYKPWLMDDPVYLRRHPALEAFLQAHPDIKVAMAADPGNFNAIPPRPGE